MNKGMTQFFKIIYERIGVFFERVKQILGIRYEVMPDGTNIIIDVSMPIMNNKYRYIKKKYKYGSAGSIGIIQNINTKVLYACKKVKKKSSVNTEYFVKKLHDEYCIGSGLIHPNIIKVIEVFRFEDEWYEVIEFCPRGNLFSIIKSRQLSIEEIEHYFKQLIFGLSYLHKKGIVHRDIKLENLFVNYDFELRIADFNIADVIKLEWEHKKRRCHGFFGSQPYLAPEIYTAYTFSQTTNKENIFDSSEDILKRTYDGEKADVWSSGIVLYILLFNFMPFSKSHRSCNAFNHFIEHKDDDDGIIYRLPSSLRELLLGMLEVDPEKRYDVDMIMQNKWFKNIKLLDSKNIDFLKKSHKL